MIWKRKHVLSKVGWTKSKQKPVFPTNYISQFAMWKRKVGGLCWSTTLSKPIQKKTSETSFILHQTTPPQRLSTEPLRFSGPLSLNRSQDHPPNLVKDMIPVASGKGWDIPGSIVDFWQPGPGFSAATKETLMQLAHSSSILAQMTSKSEAKWICLDVPGT